MAQKLRIFLSFLLSLALVFSLISCDDESSDDSSGSIPADAIGPVNADGSWSSRIKSITYTYAEDGQEQTETQTYEYDVNGNIKQIPNGDTQGDEILAVNEAGYVTSVKNKNS